MAQASPPASPSAQAHTDGANRPLAVVTGASEGLGRDLAACYATAGFDLVVVARRRDLLETLSAELEREHGVSCRVLVADLASSTECERLVEALAPERSRLVAFVNNAGLGSLGPFHDMPVSRIHAQLAVNVVALTMLTRAILPWMRVNGRGQVMNVASVAAFTPGPLMAVYYATKAYVLSLSEALHAECAGSGVTVTAVCPGPTTTGFQRVAGVVSGAGGMPPMTSRAVAAIAWKGTEAGSRVVVTGWRNRVAALAARHLPRGLMMGAVRRMQERRMRR